MKYIATFWRVNPQLKNGGYETKRTIEAKTITSARNLAKEYESGTVYGTMTLLKIDKAD